MKGGTSSLNPYAASYIPLSKRGITDGKRGYELPADSSKSGNEAFWLGPHPGNATLGQYQKASQGYSVNSAVSEDSKLKGHNVYGSYGSSSLYPNEAAEKQTLDDENDMDLAYLQMTFPGVSDESLSDVYLANKGDLEATVDMLNQLEVTCFLMRGQKLDMRNG